MSGLGPALVIGSSGQVGRALARAARARHPLVLETSSSGRPGALPLDLADPASIGAFFRQADGRLGGAPAEVFLTGAYTHVDGCEADRERCRRVNADGPAKVAEECARRGHKLTFFSSEYVFGEAEYHGGARGPFREDDPPAPTSWYGRCKLEAEERIREILGEEGALVVRTTMVFSWEPGGSSFLMQYLRQLEAIRAGGAPKPFLIPADQISTPTYAPALAEAACFLRERGASGIVNVAGSDVLSRRELVERVIEAFGFDRARSLEGFRAVRTSEMGQAARRPLTAGLDTAKALALGARILSLEEALILARECQRKAG